MQYKYLNTFYYSTFIHCKKSDFLIGWFVPRDTGLWPNNLLYVIIVVLSPWYKFNTPRSLHYGFGWLKVWRFVSVSLCSVLTDLLLVNFRDIPAFVNKWTRNFYCRTRQSLHDKYDWSALLAFTLCSLPFGIIYIPTNRFVNWNDPFNKGANMYNLSCL